MIRQFRTLLRVKQLREERCLRAVEAKRRELSAAERAMEIARMRVEDSLNTLSERERQAYATIIARVVGLPRIETVKGKVKQLLAAHQRLVDQFERAAHVCKELTEELETLREQHRLALIARDKYQMTTDGLEQEARILAECAEEAQWEDILHGRGTL